MKTLVGISGSLRQGSYNTALLRAALGMAPVGWQTEVAEIRDLPLYDADLDSGSPPESAARFRALIAGADAVLIATAEYNFSVPGGLKNALDWGSRPQGSAPLPKKKVGVVGASPGPVGTSRAQGHLRQILFGMGALQYPSGEVLVGLAPSKFTDGVLTDAKTQEFVAKYVAGFLGWVG